MPGAAKRDGMRVTITISPDTGAGNPAHIHDVTCAQYRAMGSFDEQLATVEDGLSALDHGRSETVITTELTARRNGHYSINVHKPAHPYEVIACGDNSTPLKRPPGSMHGDMMATSTKSRPWTVAGKSGRRRSATHHDAAAGVDALRCPSRCR